MVGDVTSPCWRRFFWGCLTTADVNVYEVKTKLDFAVGQYNLGTSYTYVSAVQTVLKAQKQVHKGVKYYFDVKLAATNCLKTSLKPVCSVPANAKVVTCHFQVWDQALVPRCVQLSQSTCS
uniref:Cystatin domain-containing protein n=1 Tax=Denticeps clupeoides TaxID=299321 RepID=A0AAY4B787_9TELE